MHLSVKRLELVAKLETILGRSQAPMPSVCCRKKKRERDMIIGQTRVWQYA